ncbi:MAG: response regulator [Candidatus Rokubacteria bacterium]|nr:response regulator [Candidatus Rokubacteria bacterium]
MHTTALRVLVLDDDEQVRETLYDIISFLGHEPELAATGDEAVSLFARGRHDAVVTDLQMPDVSGWEVIERVRAIDPDVRIVLCTATATNMVVERARLHGIVLLRKPVQIDELQVALRPRLSGASGLPARLVDAVCRHTRLRRLLVLAPEAAG